MSVTATAVSFEPVTAREKQIAKSLGVTGWTIMEESEQVFCFPGNPPATLIEKNGHIRWVRTSQIRKKE